MKSGLHALGLLCGVGMTVGLSGCQSFRSGAPVTGDVGDVRPPAASEPVSLYPKLEIKTSKGDLIVQLNAERAPISTVNFARYVRDGFYDGTVIHRIVNTMIQGGKHFADLTVKTKGLRDPIKCEWGNGLINRKGTIGMVRRIGAADSATSEFYINRVDNFDLETPRDDMGFAVFGKLVDGWETMEAIAATPVGTHPNYAAGRSAVVPQEPIMIESITFLTPLDWPKAEELARLANLSQAGLKDKLIAELETIHGTKAVTTESGLTYIDVRPGGGAMPTEDDTIEVYYRGTLLNGNDFESSLDESKSFEMNNVIEGWKEGVGTMQEGGKRVLIVPPELGFGSGGVPGKIPGGAWLVFEVELLVAKPRPLIPGFDLESMRPRR